MTQNYFFINGNGVKNIQIGNNSLMIVTQGEPTRTYCSDEYTRYREEKRKEKTFSLPIRNRRRRNFELHSSNVSNVKFNIGENNKVTITEIGDEEDESKQKDEVTITEIEDGEDESKENDEVTITEIEDGEDESKQKDEDGDEEREIVVTFICTAPGLREKSRVTIKSTMNLIDIEASLGRYTGRGGMTVQTIRRQDGEDIHRREMDETRPISTYSVQNSDVFYVM